MSKLATKKHGSLSFGTVNTGKPGGTPEEFAEIAAEEIVRLKLNPKVGVTTLVAQALGTIDAEGGFDGSSWGGDGTHIGPFAMEPSYGSEAQRMNKRSATRIALEHWKSDGETWVPGWWKWESGETEGNGGQRANKFHAIAARAVAKVGNGGSNPSLGEEIPVIGGVVGDAENLVEGVVGGATSAADFIAELAETLLDFRKLGQLAVEAFAWFLRLFIKALWDYVIAPIFHWTERAVVWYGENFYGTGTEQGSGFGAQLRANAGIVTIAFWAIGYGVLWTDGESLSPSISASKSMAGQAVKGIEGKIARRNLVKPSKVKEKTPDKPKPKSSTVQIERAQTFSVGRKRPVSVTSSNGTSTDTVNVKGRNVNVSGQRQTPAPAPVERPQQKQIQLPPGVERPAVEQKQTPKQTLKLTAKQSGTGVGSRGHSRSGA